MSPEVLKTNTLAIAIAGLLIVVTGVTLYFLRDTLADNVRFFLPVPPLGVAAYIFVFNMYTHYDGELPQGAWTAVREVMLSTGVAALTFGLFTMLIIVVIHLTKPGV